MRVEERWHVYELVVGANGDAEPTQRCVHDVGAASAEEHVGFRVRLARATRDFARGRADHEVSPLSRSSGRAARRTGSSHGCGTARAP